MKKIINSSILTSLFLLIVSLPTISNAQSAWDRRLPGANNEDVEWCKSVIDDPYWSTVYQNLGKCANFTPADLQFTCRSEGFREFVGARNKGECVAIIMSWMIADIQSD